MRSHLDCARVIAFTDASDMVTFGNFIHYGGRGYIHKTCSLNELIEAIVTVHQGHFYTCPRYSGNIFRDIFTSTPPRRKTSHIIKLTKRPREILLLFKAGKSIKEIAELLHIKDSTVKTHRKNIMGALDVHNEVELFNELLCKKLD